MQEMIVNLYYVIIFISWLAAAILSTRWYLRDKLLITSGIGGHIDIYLKHLRHHQNVWVNISIFRQLHIPMVVKHRYQWYRSCNDTMFRTYDMGTSATM